MKKINAYDLSLFIDNILPYLKKINSEVTPCFDFTKWATHYECVVTFAGESLNIANSEMKKFERIYKQILDKFFSSSDLKPKIEYASNDSDVAYPEISLNFQIEFDDNFKTYKDLEKEIKKSQKENRISTLSDFENDNTLDENTRNSFKYFYRQELIAEGKNANKWANRIEKMINELYRIRNEINSQAHKQFDISKIEKIENDLQNVWSEVKKINI